MPVGCLRKLHKDVPDGKPEPSKYQEVDTKFLCVIGTFLLMLMLKVSEVVYGRISLFGVGLTLI